MHKKSKLKDRRQWKLENGGGIAICDMTSSFIRDLLPLLHKRYEGLSVSPFLDSLSSTQCRIWEKVLESELNKRKEKWRNRRWKPVKVRNPSPIRVFK